MDVLVRSGAAGACLALMVYVGTLFAPRGTPWTVLVTFASGAALSALGSLGTELNRGETSRLVNRHLHF